MLFADGLPTLDWTAIAVAGLGGVMTIVGWALNRSFGRIDEHMKTVAGFMSQSAKEQAVMANELKNQNHRLQSVEQRVNSAVRIEEIHGMVSEIHGKGCVVQTALEGR